MTKNKLPFLATWFCRLQTFVGTISAFLILALGSAAAHAQSTQDLVGFWWKPTESGWGLTIQQQGARTFGVWFTYDAQGAAIWYTLDCAFSGSVCAGDLYTGTGTPLSQITGSANLVAIKAGTGATTVTSPNRLSLAYTIGAVAQTKTNLEPQNFAPPTRYLYVRCRR
ncbi:MAG: hypothetical protein IPP88_21360 [Betaproteobacteria bacterium]|nr:hypothetical protein [Betaproteobacteria bacterium]